MEHNKVTFEPDIASGDLAAYVVVEVNGIRDDADAMYKECRRFCKRPNKLWQRLQKTLYIKVLRDSKSGGAGEASAPAVQRMAQAVVLQGHKPKRKFGTLFGGQAMIRLASPVSGWIPTSTPRLAIPEDPSDPPWSEMSKVLRALSASDIPLLMQMAARFNWTSLDFASLARSRVTTYLVSKYHPNFDEKDARSAVDALDVKAMQHALETCNEASNGSPFADRQLLDILNVKPPKPRRSANPSKNPEHNVELALRSERQKMKKLEQAMHENSGRMRTEIVQRDQEISQLTKTLKDEQDKGRKEVERAKAVEQRLAKKEGEVKILIERGTALKEKNTRLRQQGPIEHLFRCAAGADEEDDIIPSVVPLIT